jgi:hypothetical protein
LSNDGDVIWARKDGGALGDNVYGLDVDNNNNIILTGQFAGTALIAGQNHTSMIDPNTLLPSFDMFLAKFDGDGNPIWSKSAHAEYEDRGLAVVCDNENNIYLAGQFSENIDFFGQPIFNQIYNAGFVSKFNSNGDFQWFDKLAAGQVLAYDITLDSQNKILVTGDFLGQLVVWAQEGYHAISNPYDKKIFVLKLDQQGNYQWAKAHGSNSEVSSRTICTDSQNNIYIGGHFKCNFDQYRDSTGTAHWQSAGFRDQFVTKLNSTGSTIWKNQIGGQREDQCWGMDILENDYPIITGSYATNIVYPFENTYNYWSNISNQQHQNYSYPGFSDFIADGVTHFGVIGDESINIHVSKMISSHSRYYNYYEHQNNQNFSDSLAMHITPNQDSVNFCPPDRACINTNTAFYYGPLYEGNWNTGDTMYTFVDNNKNDGLYSIYVNRLDNCYDFDDTIYIDYHPTPNLPLLTDNHNINLSTDIYKDILVCSPNTVDFLFQNLCSGCTAKIDFNPFFNNQDLTIDSNYQTDVDSYIEIKVVSEWNCQNTENFRVEFIDSIVPFLILNDTYDFNKSIMICKNETVEVLISDSLINPNIDLIHHVEFVNSAEVIVTLNNQIISSQTDGYYSVFYPQEDGWYLVHQTLSIGNELCLYNYTLLDSFYVEIKENPNLTFTGGGLLCPDEYNFLSVSPAIPSLVWSGPAILWTSANADSI